ncbi:hypothetical protein PR202_gb08727 [Eleusine coracana subsp. coracana]|uniref:Uncharacterized protein n=1 Tax=Eleusine coracana subsp. coracana TaxID=191504 RepID=A0AAV5EDS8_ELECO|nr:hypothetical protein QOZ80_2BG0188840 [Eleusine coracana subsp. coracana]GJN21264.1 hypothetical protein PR202_gb08727 [Eleusine coracana subsp. coracana]
MGACATKSGDLKKVKGEPPVVVEDAAVVPPVADGEKANKVEGVPPAAETDPADVSRRRSLSDLLKEDAEASDGDEAGQEAVKAVIDEDSAVATDEAAPAPASVSKEAEEAKEPQVVAEQPAAVVVEQDTTAEQEQLADDPEAGQEPDGDAQAGEEEKRVDPDSVQVATVVAAATVAALSDEGSEVADGVSSSA